MHLKSSPNTRPQSGQTMMEYIILVALLAVASIPVAKILGDVFRNRVLNSADAMIGNKGGVNDSDAIQEVQSGKGKIRRSMSNFADGRDNGSDW